MSTAPASGTAIGLVLAIAAGEARIGDAVDAEPGALRSRIRAGIVTSRRKPSLARTA